MAAACDPITQEDYYALQSVFAGIIEGDVAFDGNPSIAQQRKRWQSLLAAADVKDKSVLLTPENAALVAILPQAGAFIRRWASRIMRCLSLRSRSH